MSATGLFIRKVTVFSEVHCQASFYVLLSRTGLCDCPLSHEKASVWLSFVVVGVARAKGISSYVCTSVLSQSSRRDNKLSRDQTENLAHDHSLKFSPVQFILKL